MMPTAEPAEHRFVSREGAARAKRITEGRLPVPGTPRLRRYLDARRITLPLELSSPGHVDHRNPAHLGLGWARAVFEACSRRTSPTRQTDGEAS